MAPRISTRAPRSDSEPPPQHRPITDRSPHPKIGDRRSPRTEQKKLGTRIAGLETQLQQAQGDLRLLKNQLASAQKQLDKKTIKPPVSIQDNRSSPSIDIQELNNEKETDVFQVPVEMVSDSKFDESQKSDHIEVKVNLNDIAVKNEEICLLKLKNEEKEKKLEALGEENEVLKRELNEANVQLTSAMVKEQKLSMKLSETEKELTKSQIDVIQLTKKLKEVEEAKEAMESEMKKMRVQTEQWRKAADAAAAILGGGMEMNGGRRVSERCGVFDGFVGSPESGDEFGNGKRKGSGIRMFGDLWKKKGGHK